MSNTNELILIIFYSSFSVCLFIFVAYTIYHFVRRRMLSAIPSSDPLDHHTMDSHRLYILNELQSVIAKQNEDKIFDLLKYNLRGRPYQPYLNRFKNICSICLENFGFPQLVTPLPCGHLFHSSCFNYYALNNPSNPKCPNCNYDVLNLEVNYDTVLDVKPFSTPRQSYSEKTLPKSEHVSPFRQSSNTPTLKPKQVHFLL